MPFVLKSYTISVYNIVYKYFKYIDYNIFTFIKTNNLYNTGKLTRDKKGVRDKSCGEIKKNISFAIKKQVQSKQ